MKICGNKSLRIDRATVAAIVSCCLACWTVSSVGEDADSSKKRPVNLSRDQAAPTSNIGVAHQLKQVVIPGSELAARRLEDRKAPIVLRILATYPHGSHFRYDLEYYGLEAGTFDLRDYLVRKDSSSLETVQPLPVRIEARLPPGQILPSSLTATRLPEIGGYRSLMAIGIALWTIAALWLVTARRRQRAIVAHVDRQPTPAELLHPLVSDAIAGRLTSEGQARLERLMLVYWRQRLGLVDEDPVSALAAIRRHPEAGSLLRLLEEWLHKPGGAGDIDIAVILKPYQNLMNANESSGSLPASTHLPRAVNSTSADMTAMTSSQKS